MRAARLATLFASISLATAANGCEVPGFEIVPYLISIGGAVEIVTDPAESQNNCSVVSASIVANAPAAEDLKCSFKLFRNVIVSGNSGIQMVTIKGSGFTTTALPHANPKRFTISGNLKAAADKSSTFTLDSIKGGGAILPPR